MTISQFKECYRPICNECAPFWNKEMIDIMGNCIWDKRDYGRISAYLGERKIWSILKCSEDSYNIVPTAFVNKSNLIGYIVCEKPYDRNTHLILEMDL